VTLVGEAARHCGRYGGRLGVNEHSAESALPLPMNGLYRGTVLGL
jgi:hypothetical protein